MVARRVALLAVLLVVGGAATAWWWSTREILAEPPVPANLDETDPLVAEIIREAVARVRSADPPGPAWGDLGRVYQANRFLDLADGCYVVAHRLDEGNAEWPYYLGVIAAGRGRTGDAATYFHRAIEASPEFPTAYVRLGDVLLTEGDLEGARAAYAEYVRRVPGLPWGHAGLGKLARRRGLNDEAVLHLERAFDIEPGDEEIVYMLVSAYRAAGQNEDADRLLEHFERRTDRRELRDSRMAKVDGLATGTQVLLRQANALLARDRLNEAERLYLRVLALAPDDYAATVNFGELLMRLHRYDEAVGRLEKAVKLEPELAYGHHSLAMCYMALSRWNAAETELREVVRLDPVHAEASEWLSWLNNGRSGRMLERSGVE